MAYRSPYAIFPLPGHLVFANKRWCSVNWPESNETTLPQVGQTSLVIGFTRWVGKIPTWARYSSSFLRVSWQLRHQFVGNTVWVLYSARGLARLKAITTRVSGNKYREMISVCNLEEAWVMFHFSSFWRSCPLSMDDVSEGFNPEPLHSVAPCLGSKCGSFSASSSARVGLPSV